MLTMPPTPKLPRSLPPCSSPFLPSTYNMIAAGKHADTATPRRVLANIEKHPTIDKQVGTPPLLPQPTPDQPNLLVLPSPPLFWGGFFSLSLLTKPLFFLLFHPQQTILRLQRADAASANALETIGLYAGGIAAAAGAAGVGYVAIRIEYSVVYVFLQDNRRFAPVWRLCVECGSACHCLAVDKAGNAAAA